MPKKGSPARDAESDAVDRKALIALLNEDLAREYQAIIAYVVYSQVLKGSWITPSSSPSRSTTSAAHRP